MIDGARVGSARLRSRACLDDELPEAVRCLAPIEHGHERKVAHALGAQVVATIGEYLGGRVRGRDECHLQIATTLERERDVGHDVLERVHLSALVVSNFQLECHFLVRFNHTFKQNKTKIQLNNVFYHI